MSFVGRKEGRKVEVEVVEVAEVSGAVLRFQEQSRDFMSGSEVSRF